MLFNSQEFIFLFLPITLVIYFALGKRNKEHMKIFAIIASLIFYSWWDYRYTLLFILSIVINYFIGEFIKSEKKGSKAALTFGVSINLFTIGYFKYKNFILENLNTLFNGNLELSAVVLPLGISFFTFQQIGYLVDCYYRNTENKSFVDYSFFVSFFPQVIAGPIVHHSDILPQLQSKIKINSHYIAKGMYLFSIGLFKKVVIADNISFIANQGFDKATSLITIEGWLTSLSYTTQLYFDFSGYSDMALGIALMFGIHLPINFNSPYKAISIQDFWRRWHITLSKFLRDYIYIPLGGNKLGYHKMLRNLFITFVVGGIWHGASWMFILWGVLHGLALIVHRYWLRLKIDIGYLPARFLTFMFANITWVFFRATSMKDVDKVLSAMFSINIKLPNFFKKFISHEVLYQGSWLPNLSIKLEDILFLFVAIIIALFCKNSMDLTKEFKEDKKRLFFTAFIFVLSIMNMQKVSDFLYFNF